MDDRITEQGQPGPTETPPRPLAPLFPNQRRYWPQRPFPPYRYVPGLNPHPTAHPHGHSYGHREEPLGLAQVDRRRNEFYLYGIDLYHQGFLWEAHECWEAIWRLVERRSLEGLFLQGLILNAAAQFKAHLGVMRGLIELSRHARKCLHSVAAAGAGRDGGCSMGLDLPDLLDQMDQHYGQVWSQRDGTGRLVGRPPCLILRDMGGSDSDARGDDQESGGDA